MSNARELSEIAAAIVIDSSKNVGIGSNAPAKQLELSSTSASTTTVGVGLLVTNVNSATNGSRAGIVFRNFDNYGASIWSPRTGSTNGALCFGTNNGTSIAETNIVERMRINSSGYVGIGTDNPTYPLSIKGAGAPGITLESTETGFAQWLIQTSGTASGLNGSLRFYQNTGSFEAMRISSSGNVGIGATSPSFKLHVYQNVASSPVVARVEQASSGNTFDYASLSVKAVGIDGGLTAWSTGSARAGEIWCQTNNSTPLVLGTNDTGRVWIPAAGGLCVGTNAFPSGIGANASCIYAGDTFIPGGGYKCKAGIGGGYTNTFNINWTGSAQLWIDYTNLGTLSITSDYRIKRNIETQTIPALERVMALRPVTYQMADYKDGLFKASDDIKEGFIAHEVQEVIPSGAEGVKDDETQIQSLRVDAILSVAVKAIQEQQVMINELKAKVAALEAA